jgi:threonine dehydrogenase-like Zn-dependent dehydrogenase
MIGACSAAFLAAAGCRVAVIDLDEARLERARRVGVASTVRGGQPDTLERALRFTRTGADIVVEASGSTPGVPSGLPAAAPRPAHARRPVCARADPPRRR